MSWGYVGVAAATVVGSVISSNAAGDAADAQGDAGDAAIAEQRAAREDFERRSQPFVNLGNAASGELLSFLGLSPNPEVEAINAQIRELALSRERGLPSGSEVAGGEFSASDIFAQLADLEAKRDALPQFIQGDKPALLEEINPLVSFLRDQGFEDIQESAAASGRLGAGGTLKDLTSFNTDLTSTIIPQLQNQRFNQLFNTAGLGSNAASGVGTAGLQTAANVGNLITQGGQANASGIIGQSNAITGGIQNLSGAAGAFPNLFNSSPATVPATDVALPDAGVTAPAAF